jgi:hypothetical protein
MSKAYSFQPPRVLITVLLLLKWIRLKVSNQVIQKEERGRKVFSGDVDLSSTFSDMK